MAAVLGATSDPFIKFKIAKAITERLYDVPIKRLKEREGDIVRANCKIVSNLEQHAYYKGELFIGDPKHIGYPRVTRNVLDKSLHAHIDEVIKDTADQLVESSKVQAFLGQSLTACGKYAEDIYYLLPYQFQPLIKEVLPNAGEFPLNDIFGFNPEYIEGFKEKHKEILEIMEQRLVLSFLQQ